MINSLADVAMMFDNLGNLCRTVDFQIKRSDERISALETKTERADNEMRMRLKMLEDIAGLLTKKQIAKMQATKKKYDEDEAAIEQVIDKLEGVKTIKFTNGEVAPVNAEYGLYPRSLPPK
jgi:hypothetical protein